MILPNAGRFHPVCPLAAGVQCFFVLLLPLSPSYSRQRHLWPCNYSYILSSCTDCFNASPDKRKRRRHRENAPVRGNRECLSFSSFPLLCVRGILRKHSPCMNEKCEHEQDGRRTAANADADGDTQGAKNGPSQVNDNIVLLATKSRQLK